MSIPTDKVKKLIAHIYSPWGIQKKAREVKIITDAEGIFFYDDNKKRYIDFSSQLVCSNLGHKNPTIVEAIIKQAEKLQYVNPSFITEIALESIEALLSVMPKGLNRFFFSTSGTEANEAALKMTRQFKMPEYKIISRYDSYHGSTSAGAAFTGEARRFIAEKTRCATEGIVFAPDCYCYRCPFNMTYPKCNILCASYIDYIIKKEGNIAAFIAEPVVGTNGRIVPPPEYFPMIKNICDKNNILFIADEVMSGWFRTGKAFAMEHWDVIPDIITTAKGVTSAYTPVGITASSEKIFNFFETTPFSHGHTYSYHPLASAPIPAAIAEYKRLMNAGIYQKGAEYLKQKLYKLADKHESIGDVRGIGHFWALELVKNRKTKESFDENGDKISLTAQVAADAMNKGLFVNPWKNTLIIAPPLIITEDQIEEAIEILDKSLTIADEKTVSTGLEASKSSEF